MRDVVENEASGESRSARPGSISQMLGTVAGLVAGLWFFIAWMGAGLDCGLDQLGGAQQAAAESSNVKRALAVAIAGPLLGWLIVPALLRWREHRNGRSMVIIVAASIVGIALLAAVSRWDVCGS